MVVQESIGDIFRQAALNSWPVFIGKEVDAGGYMTMGVNIYMIDNLPHLACLTIPYHALDISSTQIN